MSSERSPLLAPEVQASEDNFAPPVSSNVRIGTIVGDAFKWRKHPRDLWLAASVVALLNFGTTVITPASQTLILRAVCRVYGDDPNDQICMEPGVLSHFAFVWNMLTIVGALIAVIMQIPMGFVLDKKGNRLALMLNLTGIILYWVVIVAAGFIDALPLWILYLAPIFFLVGGGPLSTPALLFAAINGKVNPQQRVIAFSIILGLSSIATLIGSLLVPVTAWPHYWISCLIGFLAFAAMFLPIFFIIDETPRESAEHFRDEDGLEGAEGDPLLGDASAPNNSGTPNWAWMRSNAALLITFFFSVMIFCIGEDASYYIILWIWTRFQEIVGRTGPIYLIPSIVSPILYLIILPIASSWITLVRESEPSSKDLTLSTSGVILSLLGAIIIAFSPNTIVAVFGYVVFNLGSGVVVTLRSFMASKVDVAFSGRLFGAIAATSMIGNLAGIQLMRALYILGDSQELWVALEFIASAVAFLIVLALLGWLHIKRY